MKKKYKIILSILILVLLSAGGASYYFMEIKTYEVADEEIKEILESDYEIQLPGETDSPAVIPDSNKQDQPILSENNDKNPTPIEKQGVATKKDEPVKNSTSTGDPSQPKVKKVEAVNSDESVVSSSEPTTSPKKTSKPAKPKPLNATDIKERYRPTFQSLESQANARIDALVGRAISEYRSKQESGESISIGYFYQKYSSSGRALENQTDATFEYVYGALKKDLKKHGFSTAHAQSFRQEYENSKKAREAALLNMAKSAL